jgi:DNA-binding LacI/PurR family transcriptional regulator
MVRRKPSISQIAEEAGVSPSTVSRVINQHPDVSEAAREQVTRVIKRLGYRRNAIARSLITRRTNTLALITSDLDRFGPCTVLSEAETQTQALGYKLYFNMVSLSDLCRVADVLHDLLAYGVDGIIWAMLETSDTMVRVTEILVGLNIPVVCISADAQNPLPAVVCDNRLGGQIGTEYLLRQGYRNIGLITGLPDLLASQERQHGWEDALLAAGLSPAPHQIVEGDWTAVSGEQGLRRLVQQFPQIDAVFASNDQMALGVLKAANDLALPVPARLGVVGFDNIPEAFCFIPPLTTLHNPFREMGMIAVRQLDQMLREHNHQEGSRSAPVKIVLKPELIVRESAVRR